MSSPRSPMIRYHILEYGGTSTRVPAESKNTVLTEKGGIAKQSSDIILLFHNGKIRFGLGMAPKEELTLAQSPLKCQRCVEELLFLLEFGDRRIVDSNYGTNMV